ncbi:hypothetical protein Tcan_08882 [Toxocara canis]|uniref:Major sperm protein n=1 Tax=Toxocara canis TaxID=6265 RepID=A0A0B2W203_TOXCA|nr:hypothetical protein Tcan_08882 [Toxocara canis]
MHIGRSSGVSEVGYSQSGTTQPTKCDHSISQMRSHKQEKEYDSVKSVLYFSAVKDYDMARAFVRMRNTSDKNLNFKFKCEIGCDVSAHPTGNGTVAPHSIHHSVLTWHRPPGAVSWKDVRPPRLAIVTNFSTGSDINSGEKRFTEFTSAVTSMEQEIGDIPPKMVLSFCPDKSPIALSCETMSDESASDIQTEEAVANRGMTRYNAFIEWMQLHPMKLLVATVIIFMIVVCSLSAERDDYDY